VNKHFSPVAPVDDEAARDAEERQTRLTKPPGALGALEEVSIRLAAMARACPAPVPQRPVVVIFAGDHGVHARGVSPWPQDVTAQMIANFLAGGAAANAIAAQVGAHVVVVDVGVATDLPFALDEPGVASGGARLISDKVRAGTRDLSVEAAMTRAEAEAALLVGVRVAERLVAEGHDVLVPGDMGIANTTAAAALIAAFTGADPAEVTGRGTGIDDQTLALKTAVVAQALALHAEAVRLSEEDPIQALAALGGLEHAALAGFLIGAAGQGIPVLLDGVNTAAAALVARAFDAAVVGYCIAGHRSAEPGHTVALAALDLTPLIDLGLRLGEGTGGLLAVPVLQSAARVLAEMATFDGAGVTQKSAASVGPADR
jgi:nicotinate-nucleotide--dimethylbenzimidazole phosphoribosyltransferase